MACSVDAGASFDTPSNVVVEDVLKGNLEIKVNNQARPPNNKYSSRNSIHAYLMSRED
jgi:hypothetical protein